jgi:hypothetical protein
MGQIGKVFAILTARNKTKCDPLFQARIFENIYTREIFDLACWKSRRGFFI